MHPVHVYRVTMSGTPQALQSEGPDGKFAVVLVPTGGDCLWGISADSQLATIAQGGSETIPATNPERIFVKGTGTLEVRVYR